ncbi:hypothetical protein [Tsukamurella strandjordii]|uniref:Uncharacterized protein n=1 Tax=Tsukamurella strandjordii TaxID=147577 RepID=A0AA90S892_9ACTN|nr:hypothetical protein [Tsukamurella strandjordii]MDP0398540.1 hypothetical protein [Tsukamurella strandjordii]
MSAPTPGDMPGAQEKRIEVTIEQARAENATLRAEVNAYKHRDRVAEAVKKNPAKLGGGFEYDTDLIAQDLEDDALVDALARQRDMILRNMPGRVQYQADQGRMDVHTGYDPLRAMMDQEA